MLPLPYLISNLVPLAWYVLDLELSYLLCKSWNRGNRDGELHYSAIQYYGNTERQNGELHYSAIYYYGNTESGRARSARFPQAFVPKIVLVKCTDNKSDVNMQLTTCDVGYGALL